MSARRVREGSGSFHSSLEGGENKIPLPPLSDIFAGIPFVLVGGRATRLYMPERMTLDTDVLVSESDALLSEDALEKYGAEKRGSLAIPGESWQLPGGEILDLLFTTTTWMEIAVRNPCFDSNHCPVIALPWLILMKLRAGRVQDLADITRMMGAASEQELQKTKKTVEQYAPEDLPDVESMIELGKLEHVSPTDHNQ